MRLRSSLAKDGLPKVARRSGASRERRPLRDFFELDTEQQQAVLRRQEDTGRSFGESAVELGLVTEEQIRRGMEEQQGYTILSANDDRVDSLVVTAFDTDDVLARTARDLRGAIIAALHREERPVRSIALVGLDTAAEVPVLAANLAVACAQTGITTLLVDAEVDHPHQHALFRLRNQAGLSTLMSGEHVGLVQPAAIPRLSVLVSGPTLPNASELFDRHGLASVLEVYADDFGLILIDAGCGAAAAAAASGLDAAIVTVRRDVTETHELSSLVELLKGEGQVLGIVLVD